MALIEVRISQNIYNGMVKLDLGKANGEFNSYKESTEIKLQLDSLKQFHVDLGTSIKSVEAGH
jgi:hypothetical protein